jgi:hypothetical protein
MENRLVNGLVIGLIMTVVAGTPRCVATPTLRLDPLIYDISVRVCSAVYIPDKILDEAKVEASFVLI